MRKTPAKFRKDLGIKHAQKEMADPDAQFTGIGISCLAYFLKHLIRLLQKLFRSLQQELSGRRKFYTVCAAYEKRHPCFGFEVADDLGKSLPGKKKRLGSFGNAMLPADLNKTL